MFARVIMTSMFAAFLLTAGFVPLAAADDPLGWGNDKQVRSEAHGSYGYVEASVFRPGVQISAPPVYAPRLDDTTAPGSAPKFGANGVPRPTRLPGPYPGATPDLSSLDPLIVADTASRVAGSVQVPAARFVMQPDPARNEWNALPVGFPVWLHVEHPDGIGQRVVDGPVMVELNAYPVAGLFETGDGRRYRCVGTSVRGLDEDPKAKSPTCHHVYLDRGDYVISARVEWRVDWSALGQSGSLRLVSEPDFYQLKVIELRSVVTR